MRRNIALKISLLLSLAIIVVETSLLLTIKYGHKFPAESQRGVLGTFEQVDSLNFRPIDGAIANENYLPKDGCVPDPQTAVSIAEAVWLPIYGKNIYDELPFNSVLLKDSIWIVEGTLQDGYVGGTVSITLRKKDGQILNVTHYK